jgi:hypothetical protein
LARFQQTGHRVGLSEAGPVRVATQEQRIRIRHAIPLFLFIAGVSFAGQFTTSLGDSYPYVISAITTDSAGNTYIVGSRQLATAGTVTLNSSTGLGAGTDVFVSKLDPSGNLLFTDTFAGKGVDTGIAIALDPSGNIYIGGTTTSPDFPLSEALQTQSNSNGTGFIIKLTNDGTTILYSTYFGGALGASSVSGLATDTKGNLYVTGLTNASDFVQASGLPTAPLTPVNAFVTVSNVFVAEVPAAGGKILYSGEIAPTGNQAFATYPAAPGIAVDSAGEVFLRYNNTFNNGFIAKINAAGAGFGFSPISFPATVNAITVDAAGDTYLATGGTIEKLNSTGTAAWTFTLPPGIVDSSPTSISLDVSGNVWATGMTSSTTFPKCQRVDHRHRFPHRRKCKRLSINLLRALSRIHYGAGGFGRSLGLSSRRRNEHLRRRHRSASRARKEYFRVSKRLRKQRDGPSVAGGSGRDLRPRYRPVDPRIGHANERLLSYNPGRRAGERQRHKHPAALRFRQSDQRGFSHGNHRELSGNGSRHQRNGGQC